VDKVKKEALARDGYKCVECGTKGSKKNPLTMHHIKYRSRGGKTVLENVRILCQVCHARLHKEQG